MQNRNPTLLALGLICVSLGASAQATSNANEILLAATGPFEDTVGAALARNDKAISKLLTAAGQQADAVKKNLPPEAAQQFERLFATIHQAAERKDDLAVAENCVTVFRLLVDNLKADALKVPRQVALLDYAGYKLQVLAAAEIPDWDAMSKVAAEADGWWKELGKAKVSNKNLRATVNSAIGGLKQATRERNLAMVKFAAQIDLDLVDLLEGYFKGKK